MDLAGRRLPLRHDSGSPFLNDTRAPSGELPRDTAVSIAGKLVMNGIDHFGKLVIAKFNLPGRFLGCRAPFSSARPFAPEPGQFSAEDNAYQFPARSGSTRGYVPYE